MLGEQTPSLLEVTIGVVTALPLEHFIASRVLACNQEVAGKGNPPIQYQLGRIRSRSGYDHIVAVTTLPGMGTHATVCRVVQMRADCESLQYIILCGIACAVPNPDSPKDHVRLGDIVVCDHNGTVQYEKYKETASGQEPRTQPRPPSSVMLEAIARLESRMLGDERPWERTIDEQLQALGEQWARPDDDNDLLQESWGGPVIQHPYDPARVPGRPKLFKGVIASGNRLVARAEARNKLRDRYLAKAIEMEASGFADAAHDTGLQYQVVRGTCDYGNELKSDKWQNYAALISACFTRSLIEEMPAPRATQHLCLGPGLSQAIADNLEGSRLDPVYPKNVQQIGISLYRHLVELFETMEYESAKPVADELAELIKSKKDELSKVDLRSWSEMLIRFEATRALNSKRPDEPLDLSKAWTFLRDIQDG